MKSIIPFFACLISLFYSIDAHSQEVTVSTIVADIDASGGMTSDAAGNLYASNFGDSFSIIDSNAIVYKIDRTTFEASVFAEGFIGASGACFDSQGNFYQANHAGNRISKVYPDGTVEYDWSTEGFSVPIGVVADSEDNIFVCNCGGNNIRKISSDGSSEIFAETSLFNCPNGLTIDEENNLYACNYSDGKVLKIDPNGIVSELVSLPTLSGGPTPVGNGHLIYSNGFLFVNTIGTGQVHRVCPLSGDSEAIAGQAFGFSNNDGIGLSATFSKPNGITASLTGDTLFLNGSSHTWPGNPAGLNPSNVRMITGVNALSDELCPPIPLFSQVTSGPIVQSLSVSVGGSWADYDNDGDVDLFIASIFGNNRLYQNDGTGEFNLVNGDVSNDGGSSSNGIWGDYNNDGYLDLYVSNNPSLPAPPEENFLYKNEGPPNYNLVRVMNEFPVTKKNYTWSSSWVDYDQDGDLDLHVPDNKHEELDFFFENNGSQNPGNIFSEVLPEFITDIPESTGVASWMDYDNDCDQDLFLLKSGRTHASGGENNRMFHNNLSETGALDFTRIYTADMVNHLDGINPLHRAKDFQASWADYDNDGDMDVYLGNFDGPNFLYRNEGDSIFTQINSGTLVTDSTATIGSTWGDFDNDGDLDLFVSNGIGQTCRYYENQNDGTFISQDEDRVGSPVVNISGSQGTSNADINNDGYLDLYVANAANPAQIFPDYLYLNNGGDNGYLILSLKGVDSNTSAFGTKVRIKTNVDGEEKWQMRVLTGSPTGDRSQNSLRIHFGLGQAEIIDTMIVEWPNCVQRIFTDVAVNQICELSESGETTCVLDFVNSIEVLKTEKLDFKIVPNPSIGNSVSIKLINNVSPSLTFHLIDLNGKIIHTNAVIGNSEKLELSLEGLNAGIYFIQLESEEGRITRKLIKY